MAEEKGPIRYRRRSCATVWCFVGSTRRKPTGKLVAMTRSSRISPILLAVGIVPCACADAQPPPAPESLVTGAATDVGSAGPGPDVSLPPAPTDGPTDPVESTSTPSGPTSDDPTPSDPTPPRPPSSPTPSGPSQPAQTTATVFQAEDEEIDGQYAEIVSSPFDGVALYANGDSISIEYDFSSEPGSYRADITGASSNNLSATGELRLDTRSVGRFAFRGTDSAVESVEFSVQTPGTRTLTLTATNDNNTWDLFIDQIEITPVD